METAYLELKSTILGGRVLRARTPDGIGQEIYALLVTYQALRTAIARLFQGHSAMSGISRGMAADRRRAERRWPGELGVAPSQALLLAGWRPSAT